MLFDSSIEISGIFRSPLPQRIIPPPPIEAVAPPIQKKKWRLFNERIDSLKFSRRLGNRDLRNYWNTMCHLCQNAELNNSEGACISKVGGGGEGGLHK